MRRDCERRALELLRRLRRGPSFSFTFEHALDLTTEQRKALADEATANRSHRVCLPCWPPEPGSE